MLGGVATIAALGDMVRQAGDDDTGKAGHATSCPSPAILARLSPQGKRRGDKCTVTVICVICQIPDPTDSICFSQ